MKKVLLIIPVDIYNLKYAHVFDFIHEYQKKFEVELLIIPERGYEIDKYVGRLKKTFYRKQGIKEILKIARFFFLLLQRRKIPYEYVISIDNLSYIFACRYLKNKSHILWSLDFVAADNTTHKNYYEKKVQEQTRKYLLKHKKILIQSVNRYRAFLKSLHLNFQEEQNLEVRYLPVSLKDIPVTRSRNLDKPGDHVTLIQIGGINQHRSNSCDLITEFQTIDRLNLILHGFISSEVLQFVFNIKAGKVPILSNIDWPGEMIIKLLSNADIGFISYVATDENFINIDWASGQLVEHMRAGLPVICHGNTTLNNFVVEHNVGVGINNMKELHNAIKMITADYTGYSSRARKFFEEKMNIGRLVPVYFG